MFSELISLKHVSIKNFKVNISFDGIFDPSKIQKLEIYSIYINEGLRLFTNLRSLHLEYDPNKEFIPDIEALTSISFGSVPSLDTFLLIYTRSKYLNSLRIHNFNYSICIEFLDKLII